MAAAKSAAQRQKEFKASKKAKGMSEVHNIWAHKDDHEEIKAYVDSVNSRRIQLSSNKEPIDTDDAEFVIGLYSVLSLEKQKESLIGVSDPRIKDFIRLPDVEPIEAAAILFGKDPFALGKHKNNVRMLSLSSKLEEYRNASKGNVGLSEYALYAVCSGVEHRDEISNALMYIESLGVCDEFRKRICTTENYNKARIRISYLFYKLFGAKLAARYVGCSESAIYRMLKKQRPT